MVRDREIRIWMLRKGLRNCDVARGAGVHPSYVSHFLRNQKTNSPAIRTWLLEQGCPAKYLGSEKKEAA
ncbi:MAG: XRE family transcriptional regulator [Desulfovibrionaceae bacterium]